MKKYGLVSALALFLLTNVIVLAGVAYNRSGEPDATVTLTERELHWTVKRNWTDREDTGLYLFLRYDPPGYGYNYYKNTRWEDHWFDQQKLAELGFDTSYPLEDNKASRYYGRQLPRQAYVVLEFNGNAYQSWSKNQIARIKEMREKLSKEKDSKKIKTLKRTISYFEGLVISQSRLFTIDAGRDPQLLRKQYPDQSKYIITPAVFGISLQYHHNKKGQTKPPSNRYLSGNIHDILVSEIYVNSDYRPFFISDINTHTNIQLFRSPPLSSLKPRYQVTLHFGKRYEPWIADVKKLK